MSYPSDPYLAPAVVVDTSSPLPTQTGVRPISEMTDRQIAEETLTWLRTVGTVVESIQSGGMSGMMGAMFKSMGKR